MNDWHAQKPHLLCPIDLARMQVKENVELSEIPDIAVEIISLAKSYGSVVALNSVNLRIESGRYFVLLGPSGGGKTTLLRLIGGFIRPSQGRVLLHGHDVSELPPNKRPTSMVFQSFALFPHMTVAKNVGYGLRLRKLPGSEVLERVDEMLEMVGLTGLGGRMPHELSGGQQQRVQLARSLVLETDILLLDEPLAALDAKLHKSMCIELKRLQEKVGITFIHVTHNQEEAMTVADDMAIIADGRLVEAGNAAELYENPIERFTADFIGENNIFDGSVKDIGEENVMIDLGFGTIKVLKRGKTISIGDDVSVSIRSELLRIVGGDEPGEKLPGVFDKDVYLGLTTSDLVTLPNGQGIIARRLSDRSEPPDIRRGDDVWVGWNTVDGRLHLR